MEEVRVLRTYNVVTADMLSLQEDRGAQRGGGQGGLAETETMKPTPQNFARSTPYLAAVSSRPSLRMVRMVEVATCAVRGSGHREQAAVEAVWRVQTRLELDGAVELW